MHWFKNVLEMRINRLNDEDSQYAKHGDKNQDAKYVRSSEKAAPYYCRTSERHVPYHCAISAVNSAAPLLL